MELQRVIGLRRSVRYLDVERPVEREKLQKMLEAARRASHWGNVQALRAVVIERATADPEVLEKLEAFVGGFQVKVAPVVIVWYLDTDAVDEQPERLREIVNAQAMGVELEPTKEYLEKSLIPFFQRITDHLKAPGPTEIDCGQGIAQATLMAFDQGLGTCLLGGAKFDNLKAALGLPTDPPQRIRMLLLQTVGYPAEDVEAAGQRPRLPFEELYFINRFGEPFPRDPEVVSELEETGLIQPVGPADPEQREKELKAIADRFNLPPY